VHGTGTALSFLKKKRKTNSSLMMICHAEMLRVRIAGCIVVCCAGARVQARLCGGAVPVPGADLSC